MKSANGARTMVRKKEGNRRHRHQYMLVGFAAFACYFNTLFGSFVFDDSEAIVKNKDVMPYTPLSQVFANDFWGTDVALNSSHKSYRPLTILSYRLNVVLSHGKLNAMHFHTTNVLLYVALCILTIPVYDAFVRKSKGRNFADVPFQAAMLFAVHPVHTEVVAGLVGRADLLGALLFLLSFLLYRRVASGKSTFMFLAFTCLVAAAVLCKETAITVLALCLLYDVLSSKLLHENPTRDYKPFLYRTTGLVVSGLIILYFRMWIMDFQGPIFTKIDNPAAYSNSLFSRIFTYNYIYFLNVLLMLWPEWLCFDWSMGCIPLIEELCDIRIVFVVALWTAAVVSAFVFFQRYKHGQLCTSTVFAVALIVFPFIPASNLFLKVGFVIAERTLLLPSAGFCLLVVLGLRRLTFNMKKPEYIYLMFYIMCTAFAMRTVQRNVDWLNEESLFVSALRVCPLNAKVHYNVAKVAADRHNKLLAVSEYRRAIELNPDYEQAMNNLANLLREERRFVEAEVLLRRAVEVRPNFAAAWMNLGIVLTNLNQTKEAEECYHKAIAFRPKYPDCYYNLGNLYLDMKRNDAALRAWEQAVHYKPTHTAAWSNTLVLLDSLSRYEDVLSLGRTALMYNPKSPALHFSIANTLGKIKKFAKAEKHFLEALNLNPHNALYYSNLGVLYHRWGKIEKAREMYKKALQIDPTMKTTESNLRKLLTAQNDTY